MKDNEEGGEADGFISVDATRLHGLKVHFISLVPNPANKRHLIAKARGSGSVVEKEIRIIKRAPSRRMVYGIVAAPDEVDDEGDFLTACEIERAAYAFMQAARTKNIDADHAEGASRGFVAESWLVKSGDPLFAEEPEGSWAVGIKVTDEKTWQRVEDEEIVGFSMGGVGKREPVQVNVEKNAPMNGAEDKDVADFVTVENKDRTLGQRIAKALAELVKGESEIKESGIEAAPEAAAEPVEKAAEHGGGSDPHEPEPPKEVKAEKGDVPGMDMPPMITTLREEYAIWQQEQSAAGVEVEKLSLPLFLAWLSMRQGGSDTQDGTGSGEPLPDGPGGSGSDVQEKKVDMSADAVIKELRERVELLEQQTAGRQTLLGGMDVGAQKDKGYKGVKFV